MKKLITIIGALLIALTLVNFQCNDNIVEPPPGNPPGYQEDIPWPSLADSPWPMSHADPQSTGRSKYKGPILGNLQWRIELNDDAPLTDSFSSIVMGDDTTFYFIKYHEADSSYLYSMSVDGQVNWKLIIPVDKTTGNPLVSNDGSILFTAWDGYIYSVKKTGNLNWKKFYPVIFSQLSIDKNGKLYAVANDKKLYSFNQSGDLLWELSVEGGLIGGIISKISFSPDGKTLYAAGYEKTLFAINTDGTIKWVFDNGGEVRHTPLIDSEGHIYINAQNVTDTLKRGFTSLNEDGTVKYIYKNSTGNMWNSPTLDKEGNIYFSEGLITSLDYDGNFRWSGLNTGHSHSSLICDISGFLYFIAEPDYKLYRVDNMGNVVWSIPVEGYYERSPAITKDGSLIFGVDGTKKYLYKFK